MLVGAGNLAGSKWQRKFCSILEKIPQKVGIIEESTYIHLNKLKREIHVQTSCFLSKTTFWLKTPTCASCSGSWKKWGSPSFDWKQGSSRQWQLQEAKSAAVCSEGSAADGNGITQWLHDVWCILQNSQATRQKTAADHKESIGIK